MYILTHGFYRDEFNSIKTYGEIETIYHYVFGPMQDKDLILDA